MSVDRSGRVFVNFTPAISNDAARAIRQTVRGWRLQLKSDKSIEDLFHMFRPVIQGWVNYYCRLSPSTSDTLGWEGGSTPAPPVPSLAAWLRTMHGLNPKP